MIRRALLALLGAPSLPAALAQIEQLTARVDELEMNKQALTIQADSEERRADEAEALAERAKGLGGMATHWHAQWEKEHHRADEAERLLDRETMINKRLGEELARARSAAGASWLVPRGPHDEDAAPRSIRPAGETVLRAEVATLRRELRACGCARASDADEVLR